MSDVLKKIMVVLCLAAACYAAFTLQWSQATFLAVMGLYWKL